LETKVENQEELLIAVKITKKLSELGVLARFIPPVRRGPLVSIYQFQPVGNTKVSQMESRSEDISVALGCQGDVLVKRMPGESSVSIFVPNEARQLVGFRDVVSNLWRLVNDKGSTYKCPLALGVDVMGNFVIEDLALLPHLLIAGSTNGGKSTLMRALLASIIYCLNDSTTQLVLSDTKGVEFIPFIGAPHLMFEPATSVYSTLERMDWLIDETESRLKRFAKVVVTNIDAFNKLRLGEPMPRIILVIDELADLMLFKGSKKGESKIAEEKLQEIVQKSRATGIHVIAATQRPSVNVVAGTIKANFPARLTFRLPSDADSRTVIGTSGAEHLLSQGDCLFASPNKAGLTRLHAPWVSQEDIKGAVEAAILKGGS
jgi:S-DNA-T family DNA segregation ATPase FtsK/SpoIIIE